MSFKVKKWGLYGQVDVRDVTPTAVGQYVSGEYTKSSRCFAWAGRVYFLGYDSTNGKPYWWTFDPGTEQWSGPHDAPAGLNDWYWWSGNAGWDRTYYHWGSSLMFAWGMPSGYGVAFDYFYGWDADHNLWSAPKPTGKWRTYCFQSLPGHRGGLPARYWAVTEADRATQRIYVQTPYNLGVEVADASVLYFQVLGGLRQHSGAPLGSGCTWGVAGESWPVSAAGGNAATNVFSSPPLVGQQSSPVLTADIGHPKVIGYGDEELVTVTLRENPPYTTTQYLAAISDLTKEVAGPSAWEWRRSRDGLPYTLDQRDLDGSAHGTAVPLNTNLSDAYYNAHLRAYVGVSTPGVPQATIVALDPWQPAPRQRAKKRMGTESVAWVGEYAVRGDLNLEHVLPMPTGYSPLTTGARPPEERNDRYVITNKHVYRRVGNAIELVGPLKVDLTSYPYTSGNWNWPGTESGYYDGFWELFAGMEETLLGRMPDYMFGRFFEGNDFMLGLGKPTENLEAAQTGAATHKLTTANAISGTSTIATRLAGGWQGLRRHLIAARSGDIYCYMESGLKVLAPPTWRAVAGRVSGGAWQMLVDFNAKDSPGLGETGWTVWSVSPIPPCRPLPQGGYLVGASLYFAPWADNGWEWETGTRDAYFRGTSQSWVPSLPSWDGPFRNRTNEPELYALTNPGHLDRSLYGPDALLVYDHAGVFVECLNTARVHPPDGREICVTWERVPKVIFRMYRWGTYSDDAEYLGQFHDTGGDTEIQAPLYCVYDLFGADGQIKPGMGTFRGFVGCYAMEDYQTQGPSWRWSVPGSLYYVTGFMPRDMWYPAGPTYLRAGLGGRQVVPLVPGPARVRSGRPGPGSRTRV